MMAGVGVPELFVVLMIVATSLLPLALVVWAIVTLQRVREGQRSIESKLDALVRQLPR